MMSATSSSAKTSNGGYSSGDYESQLTLEEEQKERDHFQKVIDAFRYYRIHSMKRIATAEKQFNEIPTRQQRLVPSFGDTSLRLQQAVEQNYAVVKKIIQSTDMLFENRSFPLDASTVNEVPDNKPKEFDMDKVRTTLKQLARDWSDAGAVERECCYAPVIRELLNIYPKECISPNIKVLVPGAGLGRLAYEIARLGFTCQGNEWSFYMLCAANFVINRCDMVNQYLLYPWVHQYNNNRTRESQLASCSFPDRNPSAVPPGSKFSMAAGDFLEVYTEPDTWNCVATVFFIDTAHNVIDYIETIYRILQPGGCWINLGPLLWHYSDQPDESSVELTYEEVRAVITSIGFEFLKESRSHPATYTQNPESMLKYQYDCVFFVVRKPS
ncbi:carnosine N-methyltransferase-like [Watersipora subatra]|uniref:carnosine N-methyltransferase-like n=1 Tax=Watersipora subatra TaxID=2589382 RepID=UPI00355C6AC1